MARQSILHFYVMHTKSSTANMALELELARLSNPREMQLEVKVELSRMLQ